MPASENTGNDAGLRRLSELREQIRRLSDRHAGLREAAQEADALLAEVEAHRQELLAVNQGLARASADSAELVVEIGAKNRALEQANRDLARANAQAAEMIGEIEHKNARIDSLNRTLASANATAAELVAELEFQRAELEKINTALQQTNEEKAQILGVVAHDLRSGIGGMGSLADILAEEWPRDDCEIGECVRLLQEESRRLLHMLATLLDISRLEQGRLQLTLEVGDLRPMLTESLHYHTRFAEKKRQTLQGELEPCPLVAAFDAVRLRQVLDNLLSNAIKYTPLGGAVVLRARRQDAQIIVEVEDNGPGLTEEDKQKVFHSFQRLSAQPTGGEESHGLGLAIAKKVVESHRGTIWAKNTVAGAGAIFGFFLPAR